MSVPHPDPDRLALAALPAEPNDPDVVAHLTGCADCRGRVDDLRRTVDLARAGRGDTAAPPPRVWQAILDELDESDGGSTARGRESVVVRSRRGWRALAVPVAAAVVGVAAGIGVGVGLSSAWPAEQGVAVARLAAVGPADPGATGSVDEVRHDGTRELLVQVEGVAGAAGADYLEAWLVDAGGTRLVSLGALTPTAGAGSYRGDFTLPADLPMAEFGTVDISAERWDGDPAHSRISLLRGPVA